MEINLERVLNDLENITKISKTPNNGCTRFSYSCEDKEAREYLFSQMKELGLEISVDGIGNIRAKYGKELDTPPILIGSHIDTVGNGGKYDGLIGVLAALEVIRVIHEQKLELKHPIELIIFAEEEGSNFGSTMLGSKILTDKLSLEDLKNIKNGEGITAYEMAKNFGLEVDDIEKTMIRKNDVHAMIELHIEQGAVLETENKSIGIVEAIVGMKTFKVTIEGDSNHAGTTPMRLRKDPMVGAAKVISYIQQVAENNALPTTVATVGKISCEPDMANVIPKKVEFFIDIRDVEGKGIEMATKDIFKKINEVTEELSLASQVELIGKSEIVNLSKRIIDVIEQAAKERELSYMKMNSGAVHDAVMMTDITDVGMIFIPSIGGKSHCPEEFTEDHDVKAGCDLLLNVVKTLAVKRKVAQEF